MARLDDGFSTKIGFSLNPSVLLYEKEVTPPGLSAGGANDTTTMRNTTYRTQSPKKLISSADSSAKCAYDTAVQPQIVAMIGKNQLITYTYPDGSTLAVWGWIDEFTPDALTEGSQPTANVKIIPSNQNGSGVETAPVFTPAA